MRHPEEARITKIIERTHLAPDSCINERLYIFSHWRTVKFKQAEANRHFVLPTYVFYIP